MRLRLVLVLLALCALLASVAPAAALPVTFDFPHGGTAAILRAPACKLGYVFGAPLVVIPCESPLAVEITLAAGDPTTLSGTLAYYPTGFASHQAVGLSRDERVTVGGFERFELPNGLVDGDYFFGLGLSSVENGGELIIYSFTLDVPEHGGPMEPTPEPATIVLFGTTMAGIGLARWRRRKLK